MLTIIQQPQALTYTGNIPDIIVGNSGLGVEVTVSIADIVILSEYYVADDAGLIRVNLRDIIDERLFFDIPDDNDLFEQTRSVRAIKVELVSLIGEGEINFVAIKGGVSKMNIDVPEFLKQNWLTWQPQTKLVRSDELQWLSYFAVANAKVKLKAYFAGGGVEEKDLHTLEAGRHYTINMNFADIRNEFVNQPIYFDVWVENDGGDVFESWHQRHMLTDEVYDHEDLFYFHNSLGGLDTIRLTGEKRSINPVEVDGALFYDEFEEDYQVNPKKAFEKNTGYFHSKEEMLWAQDFFMSIFRYIFEEDEFVKIRLQNPEIVGIEKELVSFDFKYSYTRQTRFLALFKKKSPLIDPIIIGPGDEEFILPPKISDFPQITLPDNILFPVQKPGVPGWFYVTFTQLIEYIYDNLPLVYHNKIEGLQGGDPENDEFYHLTAEQYEKIVELPDPAPTGDRVTQKGTVNFLSPTEVDINAWKWEIAETEFDGGDVNKNDIPGTPSEYPRLDIAVGKDDGTIDYIAGQEDEDQLLEPGIPEGTVLLFRVIRFPNGDNEIIPEEPDFSDFVSKSKTENQTINSDLTIKPLASELGLVSPVGADLNGKLVSGRIDTFNRYSSTGQANKWNQVAQIDKLDDSGQGATRFSFRFMSSNNQDKVIHFTAFGYVKMDGGNLAHIDLYYDGIIEGAEIKAIDNIDENEIQFYVRTNRSQNRHWIPSLANVIRRISYNNFPPDLDDLPSGDQFDFTEFGPEVPPAQPKFGIEFGGQVIYSGTGLRYDLVLTGFHIYTEEIILAIDEFQELDAGDATHDRFDALYLDINGMQKVSGTPSSDPQLPSLPDPANNILLTFILVRANSIDPGEDITDVVMYDENLGTPDEFATTFSGAGTANYNNTTNTVNGTKSANVSNAQAGSTMIFTALENFLISDFETLSFFIQLKSSMNNNRNISLRFVDENDVAVTSLVNVPLVKNSTDYQLTGLLISDFQVFSNTARKLHIIYTGSGGPATFAGWFLDVLKMEAGITQPEQPGGSGTDGREIELQKSATHIQWRYVGEPSWTDLVALEDLKGEDGYTPVKGIDYSDGDDGLNGWTPVLATVADEERRVHQIIDWVGGEGSKPTTGLYIGLDGLKVNIEDGVDIRGPKGEDGPGGGGGGSSDLTDLDTFPALKFDKNYRFSHQMVGAILFTISDTVTHQFGNFNVIYIQANGANKPTFDEDITVVWDGWNNTNGKWNRLRFEYTPELKAIVEIRDTAGDTNPGAGAIDFEIKFDADYVFSHVINGTVSLTVDPTGAEFAKRTIFYFRANGINKPTWNAPIEANWDNYVNTAGVWNRFVMEWTPENKVTLQIINT